MQLTLSMRNYCSESQNVLFDLSESFRTTACRYEEHSCKFSLQNTEYKKGIVFCTTDCTLLFLEKMLQRGPRRARFI